MQWREYWIIYVYVTILSLPKNIDMILCVAGVKVAVGGKLPLSVFENVFVRDYLAQLNPKHHPPYRLERIRIIQCMIDYVKLELGLIMAERRMELLSGFLSGTIDFWTDSCCKQQFGCFVVDMIAEMYEMENEQVLFMSRMTRSRLQDDIFADDCATPKLGSLEYPMNFERFVSSCKPLNTHQCCDWLFTTNYTHHTLSALLCLIGWFKNHWKCDQVDAR